MFSTLGRKYETPDRIVCSSEQLTVKTHFLFILEKILNQNSSYMATLFWENENVIYFLDISANRLGFCL